MASEESSSREVLCYGFNQVRSGLNSLFEKATSTNDSSGSRADRASSQPVLVSDSSCLLSTQQFKLSTHSSTPTHPHPPLGFSSARSWDRSRLVGMAPRLWISHSLCEPARHGTFLYQVLFIYHEQSTAGHVNRIEPLMDLRKKK